MMRACVVLLAVVAGCGSGHPPPGATAQTTCQAVSQDCIGGFAMNGSCLQYSIRHQLTDPGNPTYFNATCPGSTVCPNDPQGPMNCLTAARRLCQAPQCLLDESTVTVLGCVNTCTGGTPSDPTAPFEILSFNFTFSPSAVDATPFRTTAITPPLGVPKAIDSAGFLDAVTNGPDNLLAFDLANQPPMQAFAPLALLNTPNTFSLSAVPDFVADTVVADVIGVSLYNTMNGHLTRKKQITIGTAVGLDVSPNVMFSDVSAALTISPNQARVVPFGGPLPSPVALSGTPVDVTMSLGDVWVVDSANVITRLASPAGGKLGQATLTGVPVAIGGGKAVDTTPFPQAIVVLVKTAAGGEIQLFLSGALNTSPQIVSLTTDFPNAQPVAMKAISIGDTQYAWVALLTGMDNTVALFDLSAKKHLPAFDVHLGTFEPITVAVGLIDQPNGDPDTIATSQTAFLHVLVKTN